VSLVRETMRGPFGKQADTVLGVGRNGLYGISFTNFHEEEVGVGIGTRELAGSSTHVVVLTPEDTEELRQQLNEWYGRKAELREVKS
jgi:hypothetical protein